MWEVTTHWAPASIASQSKGLSLELDREWVRAGVGWVWGAVISRSRCVWAGVAAASECLWPEPSWDLGLLCRQHREDHRDLCSGRREEEFEGGRRGAALVQPTSSQASTYILVLGSESCVPPLSCVPYGKRPQPHSTGAASFSLFGLCNVRA